MKIEQKKISPTQYLLFFTNRIPVTGTVYADINTPSDYPLVRNILQTDLAKTLLLTADFLYIESKSDEVTEDLVLLALAEIDDYLAEPQKEYMATTANPEEKIKILLKTIVAPHLQKDGGDIEFLTYQYNTVLVRFLGKCQGCPYAQHTLQEKVAKNLIRYLPQIKEVLLK